MPKKLKIDKLVSINIDKEMFKEFKSLIERISKKKYTKFINDFLEYANFPDLVKIFEFYGYPNYFEVYNTSYRVTESSSVNIDKFHEIDMSKIDTPLSTYIKKLIIYVVAGEREFFKLFSFQGIPNNIENTDKLYDFYKFGQKNNVSNFMASSKVFMIDTKQLELELKKLEQKTDEEELNIFFSDLRFETDYIKGFNDLKFNECLDKERVRYQRSANKKEYKEAYIHNKFYYDIKFLKLNMVVIYKQIVNGIKPTNHQLVEKLSKEYSKYRVCFSHNLTFEEFIYFLFFEERELYRLYVNNKIRFKQEIPTNIYEICVYLENQDKN